MLVNRKLSKIYAANIFLNFNVSYHALKFTLSDVIKASQKKKRIREGL